MTGLLNPHAPSPHLAQYKCLTEHATTGGVLSLTKGIGTDVLHELESFARLNPDAPATVLVFHLAKLWIPGWLKHPRWWRR